MGVFSMHAFHLIGIRKFLIVGFSIRGITQATKNSQRFILYHAYCHIHTVFLVESCDCAPLEGMWHNEIYHLVTWKHQGYII